MYINHTQEIADTVIPSILSFPKKNYVVVHPDNISIPILGNLTEMMGAVPLPGDMQSSKNFLKFIEKTIEKEGIITIYPEAHVWPYYTKIRPYKSGSFKYPIRLNVPIFSVTVTYQKWKNRKRPRIVIYVDGPFNCNKKEKQEELRNIIYKKMIDRSKNSNIEYIKYEKIGEVKDDKSNVLL